MKKQALWVALLALLLTATYTVYAPGLSGGFLFDDYGNLPALGAYGSIDNSQALSRYLTSGKADPTGRPVALASFLIDARNWPAEPYPFKRTSLFLHLFNGILLTLFLVRVGKERLATSHALWAAVVGASLWLLHPLFVSTTLYIIQRQAILATTFVLLGLLGYLIGRKKIISGHPLLGCTIATGSVFTFTILATLSKANGALLPLLAAVLEFTVLKRPDSTQISRTLEHMRYVVIGLPCLLLLALLISRLPADISEHPLGRPWSYAERLLTQPRVLLDYLRLLWLPRPYTTGLFNDQFAHSNGFLTPPTTLLAIFAITSLLAFGILARKRFSRIAGGILFFLAAHTLESSFIPLELYYEHRNYLPALLLFWPLAAWLTSRGKHHFGKVLLTLVILTGLAVMTYSRADLWGNTKEQALLWAKINPESARAQAYAAQFEMAQDHPIAAVRRLKTALAKSPEEEQLGINLLAAKCQLGQVSTEDILAAEKSLETSLRGTTLLYKWLLGSIDLAKSGNCSGFDLSTLSRLVDAAGRNPNITAFKGRRQDLLHIKGRLALARGDVKEANKWFKNAIREYPRTKVVLIQTALLAQEGYPCMALKMINDTHAQATEQGPAGFSMQSLHNWLLDKEGYWAEETEVLKRTVLHDIERLPQCPSECLQIPAAKSACKRHY